MGKFIFMLVVIFVLLYVGGSVLFDSGIADAKGISRVPLAVEVENVYRFVNKNVTTYGGNALVVISPAAKKLFLIFSPQT